MSSKLRKSASYIASMILHGIVGYFVINTAVHVAIPEGEVVDVTLSGQAPKGEQTEKMAAAQPEQAAPPAPAKPVTDDKSEVAVVPHKKSPAKTAKSKPKIVPVPVPDVKPLPRTVEKLADVQDAVDAPEEKKPEETKPEPTPVEAEATPPPEEKPTPVPVAEEEKPQEQPAEDAKEAAAPPAVVEPENKVSENGTGQNTDPSAKGQAHNQQVDQFGTPQGAPVKNADTLRGRPGNRPPSYPALAKFRRQQGLVTIRAYVNSSGRIEKIVIEKSSGYPVLDQAATEAYGKWIYYPGQADWVRKSFNFVLKE